MQKDLKEQLISSPTRQKLLSLKKTKISSRKNPKKSFLKSMAISIFSNLKNSMRKNPIKDGADNKNNSYGRPKKFFFDGIAPK